MKLSKIILTIYYLLMNFAYSTIAFDDGDHFKVDRIILCKMAGHLPIHDLTNLELVSKEFSEFLKDSYQYKIFVEGWPKDTSCSAKENFLYLKNKSPEFQVYLVDLWRNNFPLLTNDPHLKEGLSLIFYWDNFLTNKVREKIYSVYGLHSSNFIPIESTYFDKAILGKFKITMCGADEVFNALLNLLNKPNCSESIKAEAQLFLNLMACSRPNPNYTNIRLRLNAVIKNDNANPWNKCSAQFKIAVMDRSGEGMLGADPIKAREGLMAVIRNPLALPQDRASARLGVAQMMRFGEGRDPDSVGAYNFFDEVVQDNAARPQDRATARLALAQMMRVGEGIALNSLVARNLFSAVRVDNAASAQQKITSALAIAQMNRFGEGANVDSMGAYNTFIAVMQDNAAFPQDRASAQLAAAQMTRIGEGGTILDPLAAFTFFHAVMQNNEALPQDRASAQLALAQMMRIGENGTFFDAITAFNFFMAVEQNNAALLLDRMMAWVALTQMMLMEVMPFDLFYARNLLNLVMENDMGIEGIRETAKSKFSHLNYWGEGMQNPLYERANNLVLAKCSAKDRKALSQVSTGFY